MTIEEAIEREKLEAVSSCDMATTYHTGGEFYKWKEDIYREKAEYHAQIAEWLKELKKLREAMDELDNIIQELNEKLI